jgi:glucose/arabinose dehydrogenase
VVEISGAPEVDSRNQGGLLDIAPAPDYAQSNLVYMTWSAATEGDAPPPTSAVPGSTATRAS